MDQSNFANQFVNGLLGWVRWIGENIVGMFQTQGSTGRSSGGSTLFNWFADNWIGLLVVLVVAGILLDWIVWMIRWRPYWLWFGKKRVLYDDDIDIDLSDEELERRFGPMEPRMDSREHFRASQLGRAGRPMYGDDEDIDYMMGREPARSLARADEYDYDDDPDIEDPYDGYAESAYRRQAEARRAKYQPREYEAATEDDAFDELYDDEEDDEADFDDDPDDGYADYEDYDDDDPGDYEDDYEDDYQDGYEDDYDTDEGDADEDDDDYEDAPRVRRGLNLAARFAARRADAARKADAADMPPAAPDDDSYEDIAPAKPARLPFSRKGKVDSKPEADREAKRERPARSTASVSASRGGRRTGSDLIQSQKPAGNERSDDYVDPTDDPFSVDGLIGDEDDGFLEVVSSMAESPLPPVGRLPKNMPQPGRDAEAASELMPDPGKPLGDWRTGYSGVYDAVRAPNVEELESALEELEASSRRARRRARDQISGSPEAADLDPVEGAFEDE